MQCLRITMPNKSKWDIPVSVIADHRARYYAKHDPDFGGSIERSLTEDTLPLFANSPEQIDDWAANNMNWLDVSQFAKKALDIPLMTADDFQEGWVNGEKELIDEES